MRTKLSSDFLYNKFLNENSLIGVTYYPSKQKGFQFLLIVKSGIKVDFIKYNFISYRELFNISENEELVISPEDMCNVINTLDKIYIPINNIKGYSYEKTENEFNIYLRVKIGTQIENKLIKKIVIKKGPHSSLFNLMFEDEIESDGYTKISQMDTTDEKNAFKKLKLGINDAISDQFYI